MDLLYYSLDRNVSIGNHIIMLLNILQVTLYKLYWFGDRVSVRL